MCSPISIQAKLFTKNLIWYVSKIFLNSSMVSKSEKNSIGSCCILTPMAIEVMIVVSLILLYALDFSNIFHTFLFILFSARCCNLINIYAFDFDKFHRIFYNCLNLGNLKFKNIKDLKISQPLIKSPHT